MTPTSVFFLLYYAIILYYTILPGGRNYKRGSQSALSLELSKA